MIITSNEFNRRGSISLLNSSGFKVLRYTYTKISKTLPIQSSQSFLFPVSGHAALVLRTLTFAMLVHDESCFSIRWNQFHCPNTVIVGALLYVTLNVSPGWRIIVAVVAAVNSVCPSTTIAVIVPPVK